MNISKVQQRLIPKINANRVKRVVVVHNPRSSKALIVKKEIIKPFKKFAKEYSVDFDIFEVLPTNVDDNSKSLSKILKDDDAVLVAGGDGTATIGFNGCILSQKKVLFWAFPYGNFNDLARSLRKNKTGKIYPIEAFVNDKHFRYAACYFTLGLFAESTEIFDRDKVRKHLQKGKKSFVYSVTKLAGWYFRNRNRTFMPDFTIIRDGERKDIKNTTDYLAVNGVSVAKVMRGGGYCQDKDGFCGSTAKLGNFFGLAGFMSTSMVCGVPGDFTKEDVLIFDQPASVEIQAEGEYKKLEKVAEIKFKKSEKFVEIL